MKKQQGRPLAAAIQPRLAPAHIQSFFVVSGHRQYVLWQTSSVTSRERQNFRSKSQHDTKSSFPRTRVSSLCLVVVTLLTGFPKFTNEVQHFLYKVLRWDRTMD